MSEITDDYVGGPDTHRWKITANSAKLSGSGSITSHAWVITGDELPDELIDSDEAFSEASGAPTVRISLDEAGSSQIGLHVVDFTPASGGIAGGASAELWINPGTYTGGSDLDVWIWWITGGSQTQPAAGDTYGKNSVYGSAVRGTWKDEDFTDATSNGNDLTDTDVTNASDSPFGSNLTSFQFNGTTSKLIVADDPALDIDTTVTMELWVKVTTDNNDWQTIISKRGPATTYNYGMVFNLGATDALDLGFYNGAYKTTRASWSGDFGSTDTWYHIFGELTESGADVVGTIYKNATSVATTTSVSTTLPTNASNFVLGALHDTTYKDFLPGRLKAVTVYDVVLSSDQKTTLDNNQVDPSTFWDATASVATPWAGGKTSLSMGMGVRM